MYKKKENQACFTELDTVTCDFDSREIKKSTNKRKSGEKDQD